MQDEVLNLPGRGTPNLVGAIARQTGPTWAVGTSYGIETGLAGIVAVALVWLGVWLWTRPRKDFSSSRCDCCLEITRSH